MATLGRPARPVFAAPRRAYRLEMAGRTVVVMLGLLALTGLVIFYLGVLAGKGLRNPNQPAAVPSASAPAPPSKPAPTPTALNEALTAQTGRIEDLASDESAASRQTDQLLTEGKQQIDMEELPAKPTAPPAPGAGTVAESGPKRAATAPLPPAPRHKAPPAAANPASANPLAHPAAPAAEGQGAYTVQVFSSPQQQSAQEILAELKRKGFPAYLNQFQAADHRTWYRVRVGKGSRQEAENLAVRLRRHSTLHGMRVIKL